jgi:hypothetical protein
MVGGPPTPRQVVRLWAGRGREDDGPVTWMCGATQGHPGGWSCCGRRGTSKPWFRPKRYLGWARRIVSWEGRLTSAVFGLLMVGRTMFGGNSRLVPIAVLLVLFLVIVLLTGDPPGSPSTAPRPPFA